MIHDRVLRPATVIVAARQPGEFEIRSSKFENHSRPGLVFESSRSWFISNLEFQQMPTYDYDAPPAAIRSTNCNRSPTRR